MKNLIFLVGSVLLFVVLSCKKQQTDFKDFFGGHEIVYTGSVDGVINRPGNLRTLLKWKSSTDPSIVKYVIYWNNKRDSQIVAINGKTDSVSVTIPNLQEFVYSFTVYSYDAKGNKSIPKQVDNVKVYGPIYQGGLLNRPYNASNPYTLNTNGSLVLNFNPPDTININTVIKYTNVAGTVVEKNLRPDSSSIYLRDYKLGTDVQYRSSYIPDRGSLDTFIVSAYSTFPRIYSYVLCDRLLFKEVHLPNDAGTYESGTSISKLWDGSVGPQGYPNIFHSDGSSGMPHTITFDLGKVYDNLARIEETGRDCCNNPDDFEVWGIDDITNAATSLRATNSGWKDESIAKGWTLLKEVVRGDDGKNAVTADLDNNGKPIRYIRIRIKHVTTGDGNYSNMSEIRFWNKQ
ncbi:DUF4998 domain-containing protein [Pedobacter nutrimenti]|uniref:DUF4998 domain-containing protein n=1 Tax=Pedobacter nutrimenti TaxID=1241337 RepID=UPI00292D1BA7|nr:DUF4998 domain-containing protein [Pedobacter nutrimenti]